MKILFMTALLATQTAFAKIDVQSMKDWCNRYNAHYSNAGNLWGVTTDGKPCVLYCTPPNSLDEHYISLGTSRTGSMNEHDFDYIGTYINVYGGGRPSNEVALNALEATPTSAHVDDIYALNGVANPIHDELTVNNDAKGNITQAKGSSSHWPASTCVFKPKQ